MSALNYSLTQEIQVSTELIALQVFLHSNEMGCLKQVSCKNYYKKRNKCNNYNVKEREKHPGRILTFSNVDTPP